jgi:hypothetical protein
MFMVWLELPYFGIFKLEEESLYLYDSQSLPPSPPPTHVIDFNNPPGCVIVAYRCRHFRTWLQDSHSRGGGLSDVYPHVLNRQRRAAMTAIVCRWQRARSSDFQLASKNNTLSYRSNYCVGDVIMPARSNSSSRHALSVVLLGKKSAMSTLPQL